MQSVAKKGRDLLLPFAPLLSVARALRGCCVCAANMLGEYMHSVNKQVYMLVSENFKLDISQTDDVNAWRFSECVVRLVRMPSQLIYDGLIFCGKRHAFFVDLHVWLGYCV